MPCFSRALACGEVCRGGSKVLTKSLKVLQRSCHVTHTHTNQRLNIGAASREALHSPPSGAVWHAAMDVRHTHMNILMQARRDGGKQLHSKSRVEVLYNGSPLSKVPAPKDWPQKHFE
eukprot:4777567-Amphidinium_carterae.1